MKTCLLMHICRLLSVVFSLSLLWSLPVNGEVSNQAGAVDSASKLICTPEKASVFSGETTNVKVLANLEGKQSTPYRWSATAGSIEGKGTEAQWSFIDVTPGLYSMTVRTQDSKGIQRECSAQVAVLEHTVERGRLTGRHLLVKGHQEEPGYGLYSYLLFGSRAEGAQLERCQKAVEAYLALMPRIVGLEKYLPRKELNIAYLTVREEDPEESDDPKEKLDTPWVLKNYDLERASAILSKIEGNYHDGPYLLASSSPPLGSRSLGPYLFIDLSKVPPKLIHAWMKEFLNQASQVRFWEQKPLPRFVLNLRSGIEVASMMLPDVQTAVKQWVKLVP